MIVNGRAITSKIIDGTTYYTTIRRGVEYFAYRTRRGDWWLGTNRLGLSRHIGGGRYYDDVDALAASCKAFVDLPALLALSTDIVTKGAKP